MLAVNDVVVFKVWIYIFLPSPKAFTNPRLKQNVDCISAEEGWDECGGAGQRKIGRRKNKNFSTPPPSPPPADFWDGG